MTFGHAPWTSHKDHSNRHGTTNSNDIDIESYIQCSKHSMPRA